MTTETKISAHLKRMDFRFRKSYFWKTLITDSFRDIFEENIG